MNRINQILSMLAAHSVSQSTEQTGGRPVYPYKLATTKPERLAHVKRRQSNNGPKSGDRNFQHWMKQYEQSHGPSRKMIVDRTDGGYGD